MQWLWAGSGNARSMAAGISMATIPTMAGMVAALSGVYFCSYFEGKIANQINSASEKFEPVGNKLKLIEEKRCDVKECNKRKRQRLI